MPRTRNYPEELLERGTRMVLESGRPIAHVARDVDLPYAAVRVPKYVPNSANLLPTGPT